MDKIVKWIMEHKKLILALVILVIFLPMIVIHILFKIQSNCYWIQSEWEPGDILGYFGSVLSFIGTIVLGYVAITQTERANQLNCELLKIEKNRIKPRVNILSEQLYKIYFEEEMNRKLLEIDRSNDIVIDLLYCNREHRTGNEVTRALIELEIVNDGFSDIQRIYVNNIFSYLAVSDPYGDNNKEEIAFINGNTYLKTSESKKLYIFIKHEFVSDKELLKNWYKDNIDKLMPHIEFEFKLEAVTGNIYSEKIICGSSWDISMKNEHDTATRGINVSDIYVNEVEY